MSHFPVAVFLPNDKKIKKAVASLLAPYDENIKVEPYQNEDGESTTYNPKSKWDWYQIGGRWQGGLILKDRRKGIRGTPGVMGEMTEDYDGAFVRDIDFEAMKRRDKAALMPYDKAITDPLVKEEYMRERFPTKEEYESHYTRFTTYAVVTPEGEWLAPGEMGWFGMSSSTPEDERKWELEFHDRFIGPAIENNLYMVIVDCHI